MIQVGIADNFLAGGISIAMRMKPDPASDLDVITYAQPSETGYQRWTAISVRESVGEPPPGPLLILDDDMAMALLDALQRHYPGSSDTRALRADYDHERKRVDKLTDLLGGLSTALVHKAAS